MSAIGKLLGGGAPGLPPQAPTVAAPPPPLTLSPGVGEARRKAAALRRRRGLGDETILSGFGLGGKSTVTPTQIAGVPQTGVPAPTTTVLG